MSHMQRTQTLWLHTLNTRKNWVTHVNWMNSKKSEAVILKCSAKKMFLKILQNSHENT